MMEYSEFKQRAENACKGEDEKERIADELSHIEKCGMEKYMTVLAEIYGNISRTKKRVVTGGNADYSYALSKVTNPDKDTFSRIMKDDKKDLFFSAPLEFDALSILAYKPWASLGFKKVKSIIDDSIASSGLYTRDKAWKDYRRKLDVIVVSNSAIPDEDFEIASKLDKDRTSEENERLMKYLVIKIASRNCLKFMVL